jgi:hypothetical protein
MVLHRAMDLAVVSQDAAGAAVEADLLQGEITGMLMLLALREDMDMVVALEMLEWLVVKMSTGDRQRGAVACAILTVEEAVVVDMLMARAGMSLDIHAGCMSATAALAVATR